MTTIPAALELIDPFTLTVNTNVRTRVTLDPLFVESIREHGVLTPVIAHRDRHGQVVVDQGQRRTLAATEAGLAAIPVYVHPHEPEQGARIVDQLIENEHRADLHQSELVAAVEQLALIGYTPAQIAKRVSIPKDTAAAAAKVAGSKVAVEHLDTMTLEDAALLVEFEDDPDAVKQLTTQADQGRPLAPAAERIRQDYAERDAIAAKRAELESSGLTVIDAPDYDEKKTVRLRRLQTKGGKQLSEAQHEKKCPGHVVWVQTGWVGSERVPEVIAGCADFHQHGHVDSWSSISGTARTSAADMTDEGREAARLERQHVIESNKDWKAATAVRRQWLLDFAQRKTAPAGGEFLIVSAVSGAWASVDSWKSGRMWALLGTTPEELGAELAHASRGRALVATLALVLAAWETELADDAWRSLPTIDGTPTIDHARMVLVLQAIEQWGHPLSAIEERVVGGTAHEVQA